MGTSKKTWVKKLLIALAVIVVIVAGGLAFAGNYLVNYALTPETKLERDSLLEQEFAKLDENYAYQADWLKDARARLQDTVIMSQTDGSRLHGWYLKSLQPSNKVAMLVHGYKDNALRMLGVGHVYADSLGYNLILPDLHAHGLSEGDYIQMGWLDRLDVKQWVEFAPALLGIDPDSTEIVVHGISMGAATTMMLSGEELPATVKCFVEDCGYTSVWEEYVGQLKEQFGLPEMPLLYIASQVCQLRCGWSFKEASAIEAVKRCQLPMMFIHSDADTFVPFAMMEPLYQAKSEPKEKWVTKDSSHAKSLKDHYEEYEPKVAAFVGQYIK